MTQDNADEGLYKLTLISVGSQEERDKTLSGSNSGKKSIPRITKTK